MKGGRLGTIPCGLLDESGGVHGKMKSVARWARRENDYLGFG